MRILRLVLVATQLACFAPEQPPLTGRSETFELGAKNIDDVFQIFVRLPPEYDADPAREFPLVVQLDANLPVLEEFKVAAGFASRHEAEGALPPCIVVGVGYRTAELATKHRFRDYGLPLEPNVRELWSSVLDGQGARFYDFLRDELLAEVGRRYRIAPASHRALSGHSLGGFFVLYALTRHDEAPVFGSYLAASPSIWWNDAQVLKLWRDFAGPVRPASLFTAAGELE
ncbi:MAG: alpha/beta hydrolase, partial [Myxococcaceae bacterium]|nr:alpha/beta hydrolase [Myxococcaceae bacterium]